MQNNIDSEIMLSVIIPTCNRNNTLPRAIHSVLSQNVTGLEVIVVNDTDNPVSNEILNIAKSYPVIFSSNPGKHGAASTRNYGVSIAKGKYITFLDDDDIYLPGRLNNMLNVMIQGKYMMVSSGRFYETGDFATIKLTPKQCFGDVLLKDIQYQNDIDIGFMMKREDFIRFSGFDVSYKSLEDWDFILRVLEHGNCYKIKRMDYAVNVDPNRARVSDSDSASYLKMAEKYKDKYEKEWFTYMSAHGLSLAGKLRFSRVLRDCGIRTLICYLRQIKRIIFK
ncbi:glycosyltransferase family 2 protein [Vibrio cholerae]|uniref:glycosyltransferase family 2 protein n=1 Tax=Vibrio cholerae TaxID=666 RepID=UPI001651FDB2|nr:glycosyltransferase family 2 protein [Vibrio cholerae]